MEEMAAEVHFYLERGWPVEGSRESRGAGKKSSYSSVMTTLTPSNQVLEAQGDWRHLRRRIGRSVDREFLYFGL